MLQRVKRGLLVALGFLCLALAAVGVLVPFLPTVDFLLLAAFFFYRGSPRLHAWLLSLPGAGPVIRDWEEHRVIRKKGKAMSVLMLSLAFAYIVFFSAIRPISRVLMALLWLVIAVYILSRPSNRPEERAVAVDANGPNPESSEPVNSQLNPALNAPLSPPVPPALES